MTTISVDYDGTFTRRPRLITTWIEEALLDGCTVLCISARIDKLENRRILESSLPRGVVIYLTNHNPKKEWIERRGIQVDIWIEDNPLALFESDNPEKQIADTFTSQEMEVAEKDATKWRDDDSPQSETTFGVCDVTT